MYLVDIHPEHGVVAAPEGPNDLDVSTVELLHQHGFRWNDAEEMFAVIVEGDDRDAVDLAARVAAELLLSGRVVVLP